MILLAVVVVSGAVVPVVGAVVEVVEVVVFGWVVVGDVVVGVVDVVVVPVPQLTANTATTRRSINGSSNSLLFFIVSSILI